MRLCDLTMAYSETSGGIRTYIDQKRRYLQEHTLHEHVLIAPGAQDSVSHDGRLHTYRIKSPPTGHGSYRFMWRPDQILAALQDSAPDVVELGTFLVSPWPAFRYRDESPPAQRPLVAGYFHTDLASAYVQSPIENALREWFDGWSDALLGLGVDLAGLLGSGAERYFGAVFERCDLMMTSSPGQAERLREYGIEGAEVIPLGVDLTTFRPVPPDQPDELSAAAGRLRREAGAGEDTCLLVYAGRLDAEKHVGTLMDALEVLVTRGRDARLVMIGDGPERERLARERVLLPGFVSDARHLAAWFAAADVYVTAGPHETFALSVIEAQAAGLPVVGVDSGALRSRVVEGTGYLGPVDDAAAMADNIDKACAERAHLGAAARAHVAGQFSWERCFERLLRVFEAARQRQAVRRRD